MERSVPVRGVPLHARIEGEGAPYVWAHGVTSNVAAEEAMGMFGLSELGSGVKLVRYDARGHGRSGHARPVDPADYRWDNLGRDMVALAAALGLGRFVAAGGSMGCATAIHAALTAPERIRGLVLAMGPTAWETRPAQAAEYEAGARGVEEQGIEAYVSLTRSALESDQTPEPVLEAILENARRFDPAVLAAILRGAAASDLPAPERIAGIRIPALVLASELIPGHPLSTSERLHELLPRSSLHVARTRAELGAWSAHIREFLEKLEP